MLLAKRCDGLLVVIMKIFGQKMIVKHVGDHPGIMSVFLPKSVFTLAYNWVSVGVAVYLAVKHHALGHSIRVVLIAIALHKVANEVASGQVGIVS